MAWIYLFIAGIFEIIWAYAMKQSQGFSRLVPSVITLTAMIASFWLLAAAMRTIPLERRTENMNQRVLGIPLE